MSDRDKDTEILALREQITVLERQLGGEKVRFFSSDRAFLAASLLPRLPLKVLRRIRLVVRPDTVLRRHRGRVARRHAARSRPKRLGRQLKLGADVVVRQEPYAYQSEKYPGRAPYPESAVVLARQNWLTADGRLRAGVGIGYRLRKAGEPEPVIDVFKTELRPFIGVFVPDQAVYAALSPVSGKAWAR
ncbi:hypothetical protein [Streptomyces sp. NPDC097610]|uniref:hypothetical protein n=1 Tax=Streptomyces sp. NPDC097610 TaxID=3157227 RepID=UPI00332228AA